MDWRKWVRSGLAVFLALACWRGEGIGYTLLDGNFELKGFVRNITAVRTEDPSPGRGGEQFKKGDIELSRSFLQLEGSYNVQSSVRLYGRWRGAYDASFDLKQSHTFPQEVIDDQRLENEFRELYVDIRQGPLFLRLGKQQVVWGESDGLRIADIINPLDFSWHYFLENWEDIRIGLPMARAIYAVTPKTDLEFVWNPVSFKPAKYGGKGTYWEFPGAGIGNTPEENVPTNMRNGSVGGKVKTTIGSGFDVSLYDYYHRWETPSFKLTPDGLVLAHPYVNTVGGTFNTFADSVKTVFRGEAVYNHDEPQLDFTGPDFISKKDSIAFMLGADRSTYLPINSESSFLSFQVFHKEVLDTDPTTITFNDVNNTKPRQTMITGFISTSYTYLIPNSTLTPSLFVFYDVVGAGWARPMLNLKYGDNLSVSLACNKFWGHDNARGFFNPFNDRSEAYLDIKYSFQ